MSELAGFDSYTEALGVPGEFLDRFAQLGVSTSTFFFAVDGKWIGMFKGISGLGVSIDVHPITEGGNNHSVIKRPGRMNWDNLTLTKGIAQIDTLFTWINQVSGDGFASDKSADLLQGRGISTKGKRSTGKNKFDALTGTITLVNRLGIPLRSWWIKECLPIAWQGPSFEAGGGEDFPMESLTIAHQGLQAVEIPMPF